MSRPSLLNQVEALVMEGLSVSEIAEIIDRSEITVHKYMTKIFQDQGVKSRYELMCEKMKRLEDKLNLAEEYLAKYGNEDNWIKVTGDKDVFAQGCGYYLAQKALKEIRE